jgi:hypothetical protein
MGQMSEVRWLQQLKARVHQRDEMMADPSPTLNEVNFYPDDIVLQIPYGDSLSRLPSIKLATELFRIYFRTVHMTFPIVPADVADQLQDYHHLGQSTPNEYPPQYKYAIVNFILAIGARFSRLVKAEWYTERVDESAYASRAYQTLVLNDSANTAAAPGLPQTQVRPCHDVNTLVYTNQCRLMVFLPFITWLLAISIGKYCVATIKYVKGMRNLYHSSFRCTLPRSTSVS